ncbi:chromosome segregation protein SMC [uncultured Microbacterium sp.]|uniref:chromosome segregation protein SMC n=1 Tax=uncultured Microbacterium sp. TaxID=191216 RepID=UPI0026265E5B|nr:chromosome segregation protein SMC [uncultured Microbacterium sp.]
MHLKSLTLKGFKSFAQPTTFALEPGVTCIVGPNGSGKSNVVDALAWVMGEQGAKTLRGGKMEDVIFAGTSTRGPLGRAEVQLTIDNADGALPIEYSEVTISRTLFRNGASEYAINGQTCRLLDVQELLSDSGLGREMHVIVGQGRLDSVLAASPEDRRGFIEEAAGILKHRRRKEKTLRKLEAMEANLTRLSDLAGELRRQLKPLGKQAEIAREAATIAAVVRDAKARLYADDLVALRTQLADHARNEQERHAERLVLQDESDQLKIRIDTLEAQQRSEAVDRARSVTFSLSQVQERLRGLYSLAGQRLALLEDDGQLALEVASVSQGTIDEARAEIDEIGGGLGAAQDAAAAASRDVIRARAELDALDADIAAQSALVSAHDMRLSKLRGAADAAASRLEAVRGAVDRQQRAWDAALVRRAEAEDVLAGVDRTLVPEGSAAEHASSYERAQRDAASGETHVTALRERLHAAEREVESLTAQAAALGRALDVRNAAAAVVARGGRGVRGLIGDAVKVTPGFEPAIAAALGAMAEGVLVDDVAAALEVATTARDEDLGTIDIAVADAPAPTTTPAVIGGATFARDVVTAPDGILGVLSRVMIVDDLAAARAALTAEGASEVIFVTRAGEIVTTFTVRAGSGSGRSRLELAAERDGARARLSEITVVVDSLRDALAVGQATWEESRRRTRDALTRLREHDAALAAHAEQVNRATVRHEAAVAECERLESGVRQAQAAVTEAENAARAADDALTVAREAPRPMLDASAREGMLGALEAARDAEMRARLDVETLKERVRAGEARVVQLERQRERERAAAEEAARRAVIRRAQRELAAEVAQTLPPILDSVDRSVAQARVELELAEQTRSAVAADLAQLRAHETSVRERLSGLTESVHGLELQMHEKRLHVTSLRERISSELGLDENILIQEYGPDQAVPADDGEGEAVAYDRAAQRRRLQDADRKLGQLGRVNPLALEEYAALEQRHAFLTEQLADLVQTRADLMTIIEELDERMQTIFLAAFEDTRVAFGEVFPILFPGGTGSISLTDPDHPLTTGIEVSVRPVGKKIERLSLLSGGERSLAAVALLTAIFKARPSPFYILDEVEAALDDANLGRLLGVFEQLRASSQLIVITHQKRTMEIADALYGVSMRQDGVSAVVGQRVRERETA